MNITQLLLAVTSVGLTTGLVHAATITTVGTTGIFDENSNATNQLDVELTAGTLAPFTSTVLNAYNNNLGGVIDWETGVVPVASSSSPGHNLTSVTADYGVAGGSTLTVTFDQQMGLYTNNINNQISVLSKGSVANTSNALTTFNVNSVAYTMTFSGAAITEIGAAIPSRSTYGVNGVNFRATANYSGSGPDVLNFLVGGTAGTTDSFLHFAAPSGETIDSLTVTWIDDNGGSLANGQRRPILDDLGFIVDPSLPPSNSIGTTGIFDENVDATNELDVENPVGTLGAFKTAVLNAYNNDLGGVIDWETGVNAKASNGSGSNNTFTSSDVLYGVGGGSTVTITFDRTMELYTNDINNQINVLSQQGAFHNALLPQGAAASALEYTITFSGADIVELGAAMPSRSTYGTNGANFRATANFSGGGSEVLNFTVGGTPGTGDTFLHFAAPGGETITTLSVTWIDDNGGSLANGQRRPILDDLGFIVASPASTFAAWISNPVFGLDAGDQGLGDDPDGDGNENGVENFFGTAPDTFTQGLVSGAVSGGSFTFTHPQGTLADDLNAGYRWSKDLQTFNDDGATDIDGTKVEFATQADTPSPGMTTVTATVTGTPADTLFARVAVTPAP